MAYASVFLFIFSFFFLHVLSICNCRDVGSQRDVGNVMLGM